MILFLMRTKDRVRNVPLPKSVKVHIRIQALNAYQALIDLFVK